MEWVASTLHYLETWCIQRDDTRWRTGREVKGKVANGVGSQYPSLPRNLVYPALLPLMRTPRLPVVDWTDAPADLNGLVRFAERQNLVSARVPSHFKRILQHATPSTSSRNSGLYPTMTGTKNPVPQTLPPATQLHDLQRLWK